MELTKVYDREFYGDQQIAYNSAKCILDLVSKWHKPRSVIDIGCGLGTWLKVWQELDSSIKIVGLDGNDVESDERYIPLDSYGKVDLTQNYTQSLLVASKLISKQMGGGGETQRTDKPFELAQSFEVAEHLYAQYAPNFIKLLTSLSDIILFSAAIPYQGGVHHVNEQPPAYWAELFAQNDYVCIDCIRSQIWNNESISFWYSQNILLFVHTSKAHLFDFPTTQTPLYLTHYKVWEERSKWLQSFIDAHEQRPFATALKLIIKSILKLCGLWNYAQKLRKTNSNSVHR